MVRLTNFVSMAAFMVAIVFTLNFSAYAETCTTQSQMNVSDREILAQTGRELATRMQAADAAGLRALSVTEVAKDFAAISDVVASTAIRVKGVALNVDQVYLLDASTLKRAADGNAADAQFFCTLNRSSAEVDFLIPALPPGKYAFAIVNAGSGVGLWRLSFLMRQEQGR